MSTPCITCVLRLRSWVSKAAEMRASEETAGKDHARAKELLAEAMLALAKVVEETPDSVSDYLEAQKLVAKARGEESHCRAVVESYTVLSRETDSFACVARRLHDSCHHTAAMMCMSPSQC